ncbi:MAG: FtsX-like permease family protein, partial [Draconibacterium sp.]|nr:FtsX-like permease family protein [Draconibacterium sp.]
VNSTFRAECFISSKWTIAPINQTFKAEDTETNWHRNFWNTWILLDENTDMASLDEGFRSLESKVYGEKVPYNFSVQNLSDIYLRSENIMNSGLQGSVKNIRIFSAIAFLIVLVAAFNYIILSTAVSTGRAKEIGIRKSSGASTKSIRKQLLNESVILALLVLPIALALAGIGKPYAEDLFQTKLLIINSNIVIYIIVYLALTLLIGVASGLYTSSYLSRLSVISILKNSIQTGRRKSSVRFALIVIQLIIFCSFVSGTLIIRSQYKYALQKDMGYHKEDILFFNMGRGFKNYTAFINNIKAYPNVVSAGGTMHPLPMGGSTSWMQPHFQDQSKKVRVEALSVDYDFVETMGFTLLEGRSFSKEFGSDLKNSGLINETAIEALGIEDPIGKQMSGKTIIGVVKDFNLHSIHTDIPPMMITMTDRYIHNVAIRYESGNLANLLPLLEAEWGKVAPGRTLNYYTIEELVEGIYKDEKNLSVIISIFALFSLLIAAFGLFGLTLYMAKSQTKEIGVKKVFGSSEKTIVISFLKKNFVIVVVATILSIPVTILIMNRWLSSFSYKTNIAWWIFVVAFV